MVEGRAREKGETSACAMYEGQGAQLASQPEGHDVEERRRNHRGTCPQQRDDPATGALPTRRAGPPRRQPGGHTA